ncbi:MAG: tRNA 4-thiouridine(8) synthase ThiI [Lentisphaerae bacterium]|nr:tRNA 4-thiouridine(8) synthase ThiI [Lentisphaerota bacterium]
MYNSVICRYHEIATKGDNRSFFERTMLENLKRILRDEFPDLRYRRVRGRLYMEFADKRDFEETELARVSELLQLRALGIENFSPAIITAPDMEKISETVRTAGATIFPAAIEKAHKEERTLRFRIRARRSDKNFPLRSQEIEIALCTLLGSTYGRENLKLDLDNADITVGVEVREEMAIIYLESFPAPGGLPVGCNDRTLALLSGGIDSPVACYLTMKRGSPVDFIGFHSEPYTPPETVEKVQRIADYLNKFQQPGRLYMVNLVELQKLIRDNCNPRFRTVLYRRLMFRIAEYIAGKRKIGALLTGESLGQVASQTLVNMNTIGNAVNMLILRPLCGQDKMETIEIARRIGTFDLSKEQVPDSCTVFAPDRPSTRVSIAEAEAEEAKIPGYYEIIERLAQEAIDALKNK